MMKKFSMKWTMPIALALTVGVVSLSSQALGVIITYDAGAATTSRSDGPFTIGNLFTVGGTDIAINALGVQDYTTSGAGTDGFFLDPEVGIWSADGMILHTSATVTDTDTLIGTYRYASAVPSFTLLAGTSYLIGARVGATIEFFEDTNSGSGPYAGDGITLDDARFSTAGVLAAPTSGDGGGDANGRWGPANATFIVPEPTSLMLVGLGLLGTIGLGARRRK